MRLSHAYNKNGRENYFFRFKAKKGLITTFIAN